MADTVKQIGVRQSDGTYNMEDIGVQYANVEGLATAATSYKAIKDENGKDIDSYIASLSKSGANLQVTDGAGNSSSVNLSMSGASSGAAGNAGFVPAPSAGDQDKFLKADGTWGTPVGKVYSESTNISLTNDVVNLKPTTVSAGTYGPAADVTGTEGSTIVIPRIAIDANGRITSATTKTLTNVGEHHVELTTAEYEALSEAEKNNGTNYFVTDGIGVSNLTNLIFSLTGTLSAGSTSVTFTNSNLRSTSKILILRDSAADNIFPSTITSGTNSVTFTYDEAPASNVAVCILVFNV